MSLRFVVVAEDRLGFRLATDLCDRVVAERSTWLRDHWQDEASRGQHRTWSGLEPTYRPWSSRGDLKRLAKQLRVHGHGETAEGAIARKAVVVASMLREKTDALFLVHDTDGDGETAGRMREAARPRGGAVHGFEVLVAASHPEAEAWVAAGITPLTPEERDAREAEQARLGFDPTAHPERLSSGKAADKRDAKQTCQRILGDREENAERWERCWKETPLEVLETRGEGAGLAAYTREVEERVLPLLGDRASR